MTIKEDVLSRLNATIGALRGVAVSDIERKGNLMNMGASISMLEGLVAILKDCNIEVAESSDQ